MPLSLARMAYGAFSELAMSLDINLAPSPILGHLNDSEGPHFSLLSLKGSAI
jgi:hypothetical protein